MNRTERPFCYMEILAVFAFEGMVKGDSYCSLEHPMIIARI